MEIAHGIFTIKNDRIFGLKTAFSYLCKKHITKMLCTAVFELTVLNLLVMSCLI